MDNVITIDTRDSEQNINEKYREIVREGNDPEEEENEGQTD